MIWPEKTVFRRRFLSEYRIEKQPSSVADEDAHILVLNIEYIFWKKSDAH